ncbi:T6SS phospholipase effector Tle1-like catalytic domain-containing protein [Rubricoccus marinus]|uniref:T6SS Phospholipase effector Tle1-like catalytic domain-containing protein n=1 Tax=Rubricoccus marinus TaxID=716817 RepID=A0A259TTT9_9BACT|nr:DUF2235 domain-containing protein [Rubricoccus marinus]OZC01139.1 hypothetical protein BSZ36_18635 [Rubricoccus marinus]
MSKNVVLCLDGTNNEYGKRNTNVVRLFELLEKDDPDRQAAFYDPGIGTFSASPVLNAATRSVMKVFGMAFGLGLTANLKDAYRFLMATYEPGDRVYIFGFSRGAYTARVLAGLLHMCGLLPRGNDNLIDYAVRLYAGKEFDVALGHGASGLAGFKRTFARPCPVHFLGLWDTVSSVGWVWDPKTYPYTASLDGVGTVRHAVSVDERRAFFRQNRVRGPEDLVEVWFPGVHSDVGGGYPAEEGHLGRIALEWMLVEAHRAGLDVDEAAAIEAVGTVRPLVGPSHSVHNSLTGPWHLAEVFPKMRWSSRWRRRLPHLNLWKSRTLRSRERVHESVQHKREDDSEYDPLNVPENPRVVPWIRFADVVDGRTSSEP